jgi:uncharacterized coiled-coil DUF342 family protein
MTTVEHITRDELLSHLNNIHASINGLAEVQRRSVEQQNALSVKVSVLYERVDNLKDIKARVVSIVAAILAAVAAAFAAR